MIKNQVGFTLLELMVSLALGLIIVAAAIAIFLTGLRSTALQGATSELQESANFGLALITYDLRHTNLNTASVQKINNKQVGSGIIFDQLKNLPSSITVSNSNLETQQDINADATTAKSDRITIQYLPQYNEYTATENYEENGVKKQKNVKRYKVEATDCEGSKLDFTQKRIIVQRYHLQADDNQVVGHPTSYALYCDAGNYIDGDSSIEGITSTTKGQQIIPNVDGFKVRLGVKSPNNELRYMTINQYKEKMPDSLTVEKDYYNVVSVEIAVLVRSITSLNSENLINNSNNFKMLDQDTKLNATQKAGPKYLRRVFSQVVAFRNTLGAV